MKQSWSIDRSTVLIFIVTASFFFLFVSCTASRTEAPALGTVKEIRSGKLERLVQGAWKTVAAGTKISAQDKVRTDASGMAVLTLDKIGDLLIGPNSEFTLGADHMNFKTILHKGFLWFRAALDKGAHMEIKTSNAVAGVRGTKFSMLADSDGVDVCTCKGDVEVTTKEKVMGVGSGMFSSVAKDGTASNPAKGKILLEKQWAAKTTRFASCLQCHSKGRKPRDIF
jgi:ferric-dicitrate binding protein FerR (iron transport regulator)